MPRGQTNKLYRTFAKGLITEAGFLTYPEDASSDELNTVIHRRGNRSRRFGIDYEPNSTEVPLSGYSDDELTIEYLWRAVSNKAETNFLSVQVGNVIHFFDTASDPISSGKKSFTIDLNTYKAPTATTTDVRSNHCQMAAGKGFLFIAHPFCDPLVAEYDHDTDTLTVVKIVIQVRDFDGVNDGLANDEEPTTLSPEHHYNLRNQGWVEPGSSDGSLGGGTEGGASVSDPIHYDPYTGETNTYERSHNNFEGEIP